MQVGKSVRSSVVSLLDPDRFHHLSKSCFTYLERRRSHDTFTITITICGYFSEISFNFSHRGEKAKKTTPFWRHFPPDSPWPGKISRRSGDKWSKVRTYEVDQRILHQREASLTCVFHRQKGVLHSGLASSPQLWLENDVWCAKAAMVMAMGVAGWWSSIAFWSFSVRTDNCKRSSIIIALCGLVFTFFYQKRPDTLIEFLWNKKRLCLCLCPRTWSWSWTRPALFCSKRGKCLESFDQVWWELYRGDFGAPTEYDATDIICCGLLNSLWLFRGGGAG